MFDFLKHVPGISKTDDTSVVEPTEADLKADRIKFHRESVRNGPVNFRGVTNGQIRRAEARAEAKARKKAFRAEVRQHLEQLRFAATLRGQLTVAGALPSVQEFEVKRQVNATVWIVRRFGVSVERTDGPAYASFKRGDVLSAVKNAVDFYNRATGASFVVADDFEPAIYEVEDAA